VIDNSYSMTTRDGHRIINTQQKDVRTTPCTRWEEIKDCVSYHANMSQLLGAKTHFRVRILIVMCAFIKKTFDESAFCFMNFVDK